MKRLKTLDDIKKLPLSKSIITALIKQLTMPFNGDEQETQEIWNEINTNFYFIEEQDTEQSLELEEEADLSMLCFVKNYPEFVDVVVDEVKTEKFILALAIWGSNGGGCYVFSPMKAQNSIIKTLINSLDGGK